MARERDHASECELVFMVFDVVDELIPSHRLRTYRSVFIVLTVSTNLRHPASVIAIGSEDLFSSFVIDAAPTMLAPETVPYPPRSTIIIVRCSLTMYDTCYRLSLSHFL